MYALLSVSDKTNIEFFAKELISIGFKILSTGGTLEYLKKHEIDAIDVSSYTKFEELFSGRVKTLHPKIHGGILYKRDRKEDKEIAKKNGIYNISLVCVNLYPFKEVAKKSNDFDFIIENIDIGGPSLIRAAAKNYKDVIVVVDSNDYEYVIDSIKKENNLEFRKKLMIKAFEHTALYDCFIANYMNENLGNGFGEHFFISGKKYINTKYGENPHQSAALYESSSFWSDNFEILKGVPSFNNFLDLNIAYKIVNAFPPNAICIIKHGNPCAFALKEDLVSSFESAFKSDPSSSYGGVVGINGILDLSLANIMKDNFFEAIVASSVTKEALEVFKNKKRIRIFTLKNRDSKMFNFKQVEGGFLLQNQDILSDDEIFNARKMGDFGASKLQMDDLAIAYKLCAFSKSNCVTYVKDGVLLGIGMGLVSRIDSNRIAILKARDASLSLEGAVLASEAFFPFRDSIDLAASVGVSCIVEPGGSIRDDEIIKACNEHKIALYFTGIRHFLH